MSNDEAGRKLGEALREYVAVVHPGRNLVVLDHATIIYAEEVNTGDGEFEPVYIHLTSKRTSWHTLRGLVLTLIDHVYRIRPRTDSSSD
ncbi:hypothetical protein HYQ03_gp56 [Arthrobacter phage Kuleana]|uniref:Uncharacterized protein n=1 Tax=Arthrobacter phage Kuleana TaxID=2653270 RepID=A0A5Q2WB54_9CAUD|nr:hypothetical protein HYQ03_gp56 [Arthrobacter phage Kuleana]QGH74543.1 hypothetical protein SEA_KULEANA_56 [Arthrobacter phage Kuleana]